MSSSGPVLVPASLWEEAANSHATDSQAAADDRHAPREVTGGGARARLSISRIDPDPRNPRAPTSPEIAALAQSLITHGLLQPIVVRPLAQRYVVVAGHRRLAAWCRCASEAPTDPRWRAIDAIVRQVSAEEALTLMLVENLQRKSLSPLQEAVTLQRLRQERSWTNRQVAEAVQKSEMYVSRRLRVLEDAVLREAVLEGRLAVTTAEELLAADAAGRGPLVAQAVANGWSPTDARRAVQAVTTPTRGVSPKEPWRSHLLALEHLLDTQPAPPAAVRGEIARVARRLLEHTES